jgi:hypothetical protein
LLPPSAREEVIRQILPSTVQLRAEQEGGPRRAASGIVVASDATSSRSWIVSTHHVVEPPDRQEVSLIVPGRKGRMKARILATSPDTDLVVLLVEGVALPPVRIKAAARLGDEVWVVAFPWGRRLTLVSGVVSQIGTDDGEVRVEGPPRMVDASVSYGSSGGGVFDATTGALVGIVEGYRTARVAVPQAPERVVAIPIPGETTVIPSDAIVHFLICVGLGPVLPK